MEMYLICNGCGQHFHAMNYASAYEHGNAMNWCGEKGFALVTLEGLESTFSLSDCKHWDNPYGNCGGRMFYCEGLVLCEEHANGARF